MKTVWEIFTGVDPNRYRCKIIHACSCRYNYGRYTPPLTKIPNISCCKKIMMMEEDEHEQRRPPQTWRHSRNLTDGTGVA